MAISLAAENYLDETAVNLSISTETTTTNWKSALADAIRDPDQLIARLGLPDTLRSAARRAAQDFPLVVPQSFLARMRFGDPEDPLLRQVLPLQAETEWTAGFSEDPVGDAAAERAPGLLHKYHGRALLVVSGKCAINCRYCFRRHYPYEQVPRSMAAWQPAIDAILADNSVAEVILSGGDPLVLTDAVLERLIDALESIPHVRRLRIHSRLPIVLPERVTLELCQLLAKTKLTCVFVLHSNHAAELVGDCAAAIVRLADHGLQLLNQAVLLRGVNDRHDVLQRLCERCIELRMMPYYLHQLDPVAGAAHFAVSEAEGKELIEQLRRTLPGYAVPRFVREVQGAPSKTLLV